MMTLETTQVVPLTLTESGTIRVTGSRVSLDSIIWQYLQGHSAEQINESFPSLKLADIHAVISYYLNHSAEVEEYLRHQADKAEAIRRRIESDPQHQTRIAELRERFQTRRQPPQPTE